MSKKITFSAFGRDSYYHRDWFKKMDLNLIEVRANGLYMSCLLKELQNLQVIVENMD